LQSCRVTLGTDCALKIPLRVECLSNPLMRAQDSLGIAMSIQSALIVEHSLRLQHAAMVFDPFIRAPGSMGGIAHLPIQDG
jgi:hypothetical protein